MDRTVIKDRLKAGWSINDALTTSVKFKNKGITFNEETHTWKEWSEITGISYKTLTNRYYEANWSVDKTLTTPVQKRKNK